MSEDRLEKSLRTDQWTISTLHDHLTMLINEMDRRIEQRFESQEAATRSAMQAAKEAVDKAERLATIRADQQNEWRATVGDITGQMLTKAEYEIAHQNLVERLNYEANAQSLNVGARQGMSQTVTWVIAGSIAVMGVVFGIVEMLSR
jgi:hypothetical protein